MKTIAATALALVMSATAVQAEEISYAAALGVAEMAAHELARGDANPLDQHSEALKQMAYVIAMFLEATETAALTSDEQIVAQSHLRNSVNNFLQRSQALNQCSSLIKDEVRYFAE